MDNKLREIEEAQSIYECWNWHLLAEELESGYDKGALLELVEMYPKLLDTIKRLTEERDAYKHGYFHDADVVTLTVIEMLEQRNDEQDSLLRQKEEENKRLQSLIRPPAKA